MEGAEERAALVVLLRTGDQSWSAIAERVEERGSALAVLEETARPTLFDDEARAALESAAADIAQWESDGMRLHTILDEQYPQNLRTAHDRPPFVFVAGGLTKADTKSIAVVGTREASFEGVEVARAIAAHVARRGYVVASGLARGIDTAAHTAALEARGRTLAVIGTGLNRTYPPENAALQRGIASQCAVISQFWPDSPPSRRSFPMRNVVMSGLSLATVVVEAGLTSGSRMQARIALEHGRPVLMPQSLVDQEPWAREYAARPGVHVVNSPDDVTSIVERLTDAGSLVP